jgi:hypothetical protein
MDAVASGDLSPDENARSGRRSRVVLAPRPWRQVGAKYRADDGGKTGRSPGRARETVKPLRGESRDVSAVPVVQPVCISVALSHTGLRAQSAPGFPCAPLSERGTTKCKTRAKTSRGNEDSCLSTSLRAKRSNPPIPVGTDGLLRHFAPRNDGVCGPA